jgi:hypothetical protein
MSVKIPFTGKQLKDRLLWMKIKLRDTNRDYVKAFKIIMAA